MTDEFGVACPVTPETRVLLQDTFYFMDRENYPHISLFQFRCEKRRLSCMEKIVSRINISSEFLSAGFSIEGGSLFLDILDDGTLRSSSDLISDWFSSIFKTVAPLSQINNNDLTIEQKELVHQYGIWWVKQYFCPHITLSYENSSMINPATHHALKIKILKPSIYPIDIAGRIIFDQ